MSIYLCPWLALSLGRYSYTGTHECGQYPDKRECRQNVPGPGVLMAGRIRNRLRAIAVKYWRLIHRAIAWYTARTTAWISVHADVDETTHACQPAYQYRHRWRVGDAVLWDNRRVLHAGTFYNLYTETRLMYRTTFRETEPV